MKAINVLLAFLVSVAITLGVLEAGLRLLGRGPQKTINQPDQTTGWSKRADFSVRRKTSEFDVVITTNALGLRDDAMTSTQKPAGTFRVLCLGDSFVLGYAVPRHELFVDLLEEWWHAEGRPIEVLNVGTEAWSTDQEVAWLENHGRDYQPDLVLCFPYENDLWWNGQKAYRGTPKPTYDQSGKLEPVGELPAPKTLWQKTALGHLFQKPSAPQFVSLSGGEILADFAPLLNEPPAAVEQALTRTRGALSALQRNCQELSAKLVVIPIPSHSAVDAKYRTEVFGPQYLSPIDPGAWSPDRPLDFFVTTAAQLGIAAIDLREPLRRAQANGESLYYDVDFHLNARGNRAFTEALKPKLDEMGILPAELQPQNRLAQLPEISIPPRPRARWPYVFAALWTLLSLGYSATYRDEKPPLVFLKVGALLSVIFAIALGGKHALGYLPPQFAPLALVLFVVGVLGFVLYKLGARMGTILELLRSFTLRGHWYLMPLVMILLSIGSLLVVAASSPLVAPFIYTLF